MSERWPSPTDPIAFESLCADLWGSIWGQAAHKNGRNGQPQAGVDIYGKHGDNWIGIQCKQKDELLRSKLTLTELAQEAAAARHFIPPLRRFIIATTGPSDAAVQEATRSLTEEHRRQGLFEVEVWSWTDIWAELNRRPGLLQVVGPIYWPRLFSVGTDQTIQHQTEQIVRAIQSPLLPCGLFITLRIEATDEDLRRVYGDQTGFHELPVPLAPMNGRHFLRDRYVDVRNGVVEAAGLVRLERPGYNAFHRNVEHTVSRFDPSRCKKPISENEPLFLQPHVTLDFYRGGRPASTDTRPTLVLKSDVNSVRRVASYAFDNTVLVDHEFPQLSVSPADAGGFSLTSLRGSFLRLTLDFFFIKPIAWLPQQSWPQLHNLQLLLGSRCHALTFSVQDLREQITRVNPDPIARGLGVVTPQIIFECEIDPERFEKHIVTVDPHQSVPNQRTSATVEFPPGLTLDSTLFERGPTTKHVVPRIPKRVAVCRLCDQKSTIDRRSVVPEYLFPENPAIPKERLVCSACADKMAAWDEYGRRVMLAFLKDLVALTGGCLSIEKPAYGQLRLWLLSLLWRMCVAKGPAWMDVDLDNDTNKVRALLVRGDPGTAGQYPVGCVLTSFDGRHLQFSFQPDCVKQTSGRLIRAAFGGVLFFFYIREGVKDDELDRFYIRPDRAWIVPVIDWKSIDFLRDWLEGLLRDRKHAAKENT